MAEGKAKRGRPKGSGINDRDTLIRIARLIVANPTLKRTTAIKELGIDNPSVIRRLRDKFAAEETVLLAEVTSKAGATAGRGGKSKTEKNARNGKKSTRTPAQPSVGRAQAARDHHADKTAAIAVATAPVAPELAPQSSVKRSAQPAKAPAAAPARQPAAPARPKQAAGALSGFHDNIEELVSRVVGQALGISADELKSSPILSLIREQARMVDLILPLVRGTLAVTEAKAKVA